MIGPCRASIREPSYLQPVGNLEVDFVDALDALVERLRGLHGLQMGLVDVQRCPSSCRGLRLTSMPGYSVLARSSMANISRGDVNKGCVCRLAR